MNLVDLLHVFCHGLLLVIELRHENLHLLQIVERVLHGGFRLGETLGRVNEHLVGLGTSLNLSCDGANIVYVHLDALGQATLGFREKVLGTLAGCRGHVEYQ